MTYIPEKPLPDLERIVVAANLRNSPQLDATYALSLALAERGYETELHVHNIHTSSSGFEETEWIIPVFENFNAISLSLNGKMYCIDMHMTPCSWADIIFYYHQTHAKPQNPERPNILTRLNLAKNNTSVLSTALNKNQWRINCLKEKILDLIDNPHKKYRSSKPAVSVYQNLNFKNLDQAPNDTFNIKTNDQLSLALSKLLTFEINSRLYAMARSLTLYDGSAPTATTLKKSYVKNDIAITGFQHFIHHHNTDITLVAHDHKQWDTLEIIQGPDVKNVFNELNLSDQWQLQNEKIEKTWQKDDLFGKSPKLTEEELQLLAAYQDIMMEIQTQPSKNRSRIKSNRL